MKLFAARALLRDGWSDDVTVEVRDGFVAGVHPGSRADDAERLAGSLIPGLPNVHSHAFQRAMSGLTERRGPTADSFWTWRDAMYRLVARIDPHHQHAVAAALYVELLKRGFTSIAEFHYLHHDPAGAPYASRDEASVQVIEAARAAGIAIVHLPVLYAHGGFGGAPIAGSQARFRNTPDALLSIVASLRRRYEADPEVSIGLAAHSLRAVTPQELSEALTGLEAMAPGAPIHLHIAEQIQEVLDCVEWSGLRPVEWLLEHAAVDRRWCLVHATHLNDQETRALAASGAVAGLCPTTEANLGDGLFPAVEYVRAGGVLGIGTDSHVGVDPAEELRLLEYGQRLAHRRRALLADAEGGSVATDLYRRACAGGAAALGIPAGRIEAGSRADLVVLAEAPEHGPGEPLDRAIFSPRGNAVSDVMVGGRWRVRGGQHPDEASIFRAFRAALADLASA